MEKSEENDWYHGLLSGAMKYMENEEQNQKGMSGSDLPTTAEGWEVTEDSVWVGEDKKQFSHFARKFWKRSVLARGFVEGAKRHFQVNRVGDMYIVNTINGEPTSLSPIPKEEVDEKIAIQLSAVIDESLAAFKRQRDAFQTFTQSSHKEFHQKLLQISDPIEGGPQ